MRDGLELRYRFPDVQHAIRGEQLFEAVITHKAHEHQAVQALVALLWDLEGQAELTRVTRHGRTLQVDAWVRYDLPRDDQETTPGDFEPALDRLAAIANGTCADDLDRQEPRSLQGSGWRISAVLRDVPFLLDDAAQPGAWTARVGGPEGEQASSWVRLEHDDRVFQASVRAGLLRLAPQAGGAPLWTAGDLVTPVGAPHDPPKPPETALELPRPDRRPRPRPGAWERVRRALGLHGSSPELHPALRATGHRLRERLRRVGALVDVPDAVADAAMRLAGNTLHRDCPGCLEAALVTLDCRVEGWPLPADPAERAVQRVRNMLGLAGLPVDAVVVEPRRVTFRAAGARHTVRLDADLPQQLNAVADAAGRAAHFCRIRPGCAPVEQAWVAYLSQEERRGFERAGLGVTGRRP